MGDITDSIGEINDTLTEMYDAIPEYGLELKSYVRLLERIELAIEDEKKTWKTEVD